MLISPVLVSKFLSDPNEPDHYQAARIVLNLCKHEMAPTDTWTTLTGENGTVIEHARCQRTECNRELFVCKTLLPINSVFLSKLGIHNETGQYVYHLVQQDKGREQTMCTFGHGRTDRRYKIAPFTYISIAKLLKGKLNITIDEGYLCGRFNVMR